MAHYNLYESLGIDRSTGTQDIAEDIDKRLSTGNTSNPGGEDEPQVPVQGQAQPQQFQQSGQPQQSQQQPQQPSKLKREFARSSKLALTVATIAPSWQSWFCSEPTRA